MDDLTIALALCIGSVVAWMFALYTRKGIRQLIRNVFLGVASAILSALALSQTSPEVHALGMFTAVPIAAALAIVIGNAIGSPLRKNRDPEA